MYGHMSESTHARTPKTIEDCESRLRTMLGNVFRLRTLWRLCTGGSVPMQRASFDQKPSWFNNAGLKSMYARRGVRTVGAREDHHGTRQRYTIMTSVLSSHGSDATKPPPCAVLFKGDSDRALLTCAFRASVLACSDARDRMRAFGCPCEHDRVRLRSTISQYIGTLLHPLVGTIAGLSAPDWFKVQYQSRGSYRTDDVLDFLDWALPSATCPADSVVVMLD